MLDVLAFLFEENVDADTPDLGALARKLDVAGFADEDIQAALAWLGELTSQQVPTPLGGLQYGIASRALHPQEMERMSAESIHFLAALVQSGVLSFDEREQLLDRVMREPEGEVALERMKLLALMQVWRKQDQLSNLWVEEILFGREGQTLQ
ncbi:DUF494 domain-containing protein [Chitinilyticum litopenaei]|uniref:DUF494 domain-containing protein n=1 Tax=Chitinilyticum litopenaei TaxID=1121276 RepID=UPI000410D17A|nr:DUF494 domain-containing protein [Chitinilyticum litopenaei]